jgi:filamentous hemagglutinin
MTAAGIGAAVGGTQGAATAWTVDANNRQLHQTEYDRAKKYRDQAAKWLSKQEGREVTPEEAEARMVRQMERSVDYETAKQDAFRTDQAIVAFSGNELPKKDQYYYDTNYNSQYISANQKAYMAALVQSNTGLTPQEILDKNNRAGAPVAKVGAIILGGYVLAPAAVATAAELIAFVRNPWLYCSLNPAACVVAVDAGAAGAPISGVNVDFHQDLNRFGR